MIRYVYILRSPWSETFLSSSLKCTRSKLRPHYGQGKMRKSFHILRSPWSETLSSSSIKCTRSKLRPLYGQGKMKEICPYIKKSMIIDVVIISKIGSIFFALMRHLAHWILNIGSKIRPQYGQGKMRISVHILRSPWSETSSSSSSAKLVQSFLL